LEAKEGVTIEHESQTLASITLQNYFRLYTKLAGMTGTAATEAEEFHNIYKLDVVTIPTNRAMIRLDQPDLIFLTEEAKYKAIVDDVKNRFARKQPVLIGTIAIEKSEKLSNFLRKHGIPHDVLNAKQHEREADIVEHAGEPGRVTIATNMAGRGTDIKLPAESKNAGGLYILGTERHESRRIDNQLRGRSGRQGDMGESRFYISLEDELIRIFGGEGLKRKMEWLGMKEDETIEAPIVSKSIEHAQEKVEKNNFEIRKHLLEYDDVLNQQRTVIYQYRRDVLEGEERIYDLIRDFIIKVVQDMMAKESPSRTLSKDAAQAIIQKFTRITGLPASEFEQAGISKADSERFEKDLINFLLEKYELYRGKQKQEMIQHAEKWLLLETIDQAWKQHMLNLDHLKEGISLRSWGQRNPLIEYKREAFDMFKEMLEQICMDVVHHIFHLNLDRFDERALEKRRERELEQINLVASELEENSPHSSEEPKAGRNELCPCGSGKKYKKCCGMPQ
jgi:preprotein translocase subunit SecA